MASISGIPAPPGTTLILLRVQNSASQPIAGAIIAATALAHGPFTISTDESGEYPAFLSPDTYTFTVTAPGHPVYVAPATLSEPGILTITVDDGPFKPAPRVWVADMCGINIPNLPAVPGGAADPTLFLSWFYHLYDAPTRAIIRAAMRAARFTHWLMSWPDAQDAGVSPQGFQSLCLELRNDGFFVCPFLSAKPTSSSNVRDLQGTLANIMLVAPSLAGIVPLACIGWELSLWLSPTDVQYLIDQVAPMFVQAKARVYVHFQEGYPSFQQPGGTVADFWWKQQGKLTGLLYQKILSQNNAQFLDSISDNLQRFCGGFNMPDNNGIDGQPFDFVGLELSATFRFNGTMTEAQSDALGQVAINAPHCFGPRGVEARVMGSGNGSINR